jgi:hypothetical protein
MDLLVGIIPGTIVPKKLAVQFVGKLKRGDQLIDGASVGPMTMMEMADSVFRGVMTGGMSTEVIKQIPDPSAKAAAKQLQKLVRNNSLLTPLKKIPLPLLSMRDPKVYISTPGAGLPARKGLPQPPFGLGAIMSGHLDFTLLGKRQNLANADMRLTLTDGLRIKAEFPETNLHVIKTGATLDVQAGLFNLGSASFKMSGHADLFSPLDKLGGSASFDLGLSQSGPVTNPTMNMNGNAKAGPFNRKVGLAVSPTSIDFYSPAECTSPVSVSAKASYGNFKSFQFHKLIPRVEPKPQEVFNCNPLDLVKWIGNAGKKVGEGIAKGGKAVGEGAAKAGKATLGAAKDAVKGAESAVNTAGQGMESAAEFAGKFVPPAGYDAAKKALGAATAAVGAAVGALKNLGCEVGKLFGKSCGDDERANLYAARLRQLEAARAVWAVQNARNADIANELLRTANRIRRNEFARQKSRKTLKDKQAALVQKYDSASSCPHGEYWNIELGQCWLDGFALLKTKRWTDKSSGGDKTLEKCMVVDQNGELTKDWCTKSEAARYRTQPGRDPRVKLNKDGTIQTPGGKCLGIREKAGNFGKNPQVLALPCSGAATQKWKFDGKGRFVMELEGLDGVFSGRTNRLCITQVSSNLYFKNAKVRALHLVTCDGYRRGEPYDWTPYFGTVNYREPLGIPDTAMLEVGGSGLCLDGSGGYRSPPSFWKCDRKNKHQFFAAGFVDNEYFVLASRTAHTCLDASAIAEGQGSQIVNSACFHNETQQFSLAKGAGGKVRFKNRKTGTCLSLAGTAPGASAGLTLGSCGSGSTGSFQMTAIDDITNLPTPPLPRLSEAETREVQKINLLEDIYYFKSAASPGHYISASPGGSKISTDAVISTSGSEESKFLVRLGQYPDKWAVSLQSISRSRRTGSQCPYDGYQDHAHFLRQAGNNIDVHKNQVGREFAQAVSFWIARGLNGDPNAISFESLSTPGHYIYSSGGALRLGKGSSPAFRNSASFFSQKTDRAPGSNPGYCKGKSNLQYFR